MKCNKCGYDWSNSGDSAHVCLSVPMDTVLRKALIRSGKVIEPQQRTWVGLTDIDYAGLSLEQVGLVRWAEAKLKEKNT